MATDSLEGEKMNKKQFALRLFCGAAAVCGVVALHIIETEERQRTARQFGA